MFNLFLNIHIYRLRYFELIQHVVPGSTDAVQHFCFSFLQKKVENDMKSSAKKGAQIQAAATNVTKILDDGHL